MSAGQRKEATDLGSAQSGIFFPMGLDDPNRIESAEKISFYAHAIFHVFKPEREFIICEAMNSDGPANIRFGHMSYLRRTQRHFEHVSRDEIIAGDICTTSRLSPERHMRVSQLR
jgi:hypothetical protein